MKARRTNNATARAAASINQSNFTSPTDGRTEANVIPMTRRQRQPHSQPTLSLDALITDLCETMARISEHSDTPANLQRLIEEFFEGAEALNTDPSRTRAAVATRLRAVLPVELAGAVRAERKALADAGVA